MPERAARPVADHWFVNDSFRARKTPQTCDRLSGLRPGPTLRTPPKGPPKSLGVLWRADAAQPRNARRDPHRPSAARSHSRHPNLQLSNGLNRVHLEPNKRAAEAALSLVRRGDRPLAEHRMGGHEQGASDQTSRRSITIF